MFYRILAALVLLQSMAPAFGEEPLWIQSNRLHSTLSPRFFQQRKISIEQFGLNDHVATSWLDHLSRTDFLVESKLRGEFGVEAWFLLLYVSASGEQIPVHAFRVDSVDSLAAKRDDYAKRIGDAAVIELEDGVTTISGPSSVKIVNGTEGTISWTPMQLRFHNGWMFESGSPEFRNIKFSRELISRLNDNVGMSWAFESHPAKVAEQNRGALLRTALVKTATHRQRRDGEALEDYVQRVAPMELWELFLKAQFFQTQKIVAWKSQQLSKRPVSYHVEITAVKGSELADAFAGLRAGRVRHRRTDTIFSASANLNLPTEVRLQLANLLNRYTDDVSFGSIVGAMKGALLEGEVDLETWLTHDQQQNLEGEFRIKLSTHENNELVPIAPGLDVSEIEPEFSGVRLGQIRLTKQRAGNQQDVVFRVGAEGETKSAEEEVSPTPIVALARVDFRRLAECEPSSSCGKLFQGLQSSYFRHLFAAQYPQKQFPTSIPESEKLDLLRKKVTGGDKDDWLAEVRIHVFPRERKLTLDVKVGQKLSAFASVAHLYVGLLAQTAAKRN